LVLDVQLADFAVKNVRNDPHDRSALFVRGSGQRPHEPQIAAAVNQDKAQPGDLSAKFLSHREIKFRDMIAGGAENANSFWFHKSVGLNYRRVRLLWLVRSLDKSDVMMYMPIFAPTTPITRQLRPPLSNGQGDC